MNASAGLLVFSPSSLIPAATVQRTRQQARESRELAERVKRGRVRVLRGGSGETDAGRSLAVVVQAKVSAGRLPACLPTIHLGRGPSESSCNGCDTPLVAGHSFVWGCDDTGERYRFHLRCFTAWDRLAQRLADCALIADVASTAIPDGGIERWTAVDRETTDHRCPTCGGSAVGALGRVETAGSGVRSRYCCTPCRLGFWVVERMSS